MNAWDNVISATGTMVSVNLRYSAKTLEFTDSGASIVTFVRSPECVILPGISYDK